jgi:hypothetical protein
MEQMVGEPQSQRVFKKEHNVMHRAYQLLERAGQTRLGNYKDGEIVVVDCVIDQVVNGLGEDQQIVQNDHVAALDHVFQFAQFLNAQADQFKSDDGGGGVLLLLPRMNKTLVSLVAVDVNDATNGGVVFNKGPGVEENFLQEMRFARITGTGD